MATTRITSRQIKGEATALQPSKTNAITETIEIAAGQYGPGNFYSGATSIFHPDWYTSNNEFYVYLDKDEQLVLNDINGFPDICTRIAKVQTQFGVILAVIDQRVIINGSMDGYRVQYDDSNALFVKGEDVQSALDSIDGYFSDINLNTNIIKFVDLDLSDGLKNGGVCNSDSYGLPTLEFIKKSGISPKIRYNLSIPNDLLQGSDIKLNILWSKETENDGYVHWNMNYKSYSKNNDITQLSLFNDSFFAQT